MPVSPTNYRGRFAPTPSGPLHLGSLLTALASYLQARSQSGQWLIRIDDLDEPRNVAGADSMILRQLEAHGLLWDATPRYQSHHVPEYESALEQLLQKGLLYPCICTRATLAHDSLMGPDGPVYAGTCRNQRHPANAHALRIKVDDRDLAFDDGRLGMQHRILPRDIGDFIVRRGDGQIAYQLACTVDEKAQEISEVVRGSDLLGSTFRQQYLQSALGLPTPGYLHLPVLVGADGRKLSKQNHAPGLTASEASTNLVLCLQILGQNPPTTLRSACPSEILIWATNHWDCSYVPENMRIKVE